jgi:hypothetical protein
MFAVEATRFVVRVAKLETEMTFKTPMFATGARRLADTRAAVFNVLMFALGDAKLDTFAVADTFRVVDEM